MGCDDAAERRRRSPGASACSAPHVKPDERWGCDRMPNAPAEPADLVGRFTMNGAYRAEIGYGRHQQDLSEWRHGRGRSTPGCATSSVVTANL